MFEKCRSSRAKVDVRALAACATMVLLLLWLVIYPRGHFVVVVVNPLGDEAFAQSIVVLADGQFVARGAYDWIAVAYSDDPQTFPARLRRAGALFVVDGSLSFICK